MRSFRKLVVLGVLVGLMLATMPQAQAFENPNPAVYPRWRHAGGLSYSQWLAR